MSSETASSVAGISRYEAAGPAGCRDALARVLLALLMLLPVSPAFAAVIRVPADQPTIQAGLDAAGDGDTVLVADGTWSGPGNRDLDFAGKAVALLSENGPETCIIDCQSAGRGFSFTSGESGGTLVEGFTVTNGFTTEGSAFYIEESGPTIRGNIIAGNLATQGGAIHCLHAWPLIEDNAVSGNSSNGSGGGLHIEGSFAPYLVGNTVTGNSAIHYGGGITIESGFAVIRDTVISGNTANFGGGIRCSVSGQTVISGCLINDNEASGRGGGFWISSSSPLIEGCEVSGNRSSSGGGACVSGHDVPARFVSTLVEGNEATIGGGYYVDDAVLDLVDCRLIGNTAQASGGLLFAREDSVITVTDALVVDNAATNGGGFAATDSSRLTMAWVTCAGNTASGNGGAVQVSEAELGAEHCIFWGNLPGEIWQAGSTVEVAWSDVAGGFDGTGNFDADPLFTTGPEGDYYLSHLDAGQVEDSPCVDAGDPQFPAPAGTTRTDGIPDQGLADLGVHYPVPPGPRLVAGAGPSPANPPLVRVFPPASGAAAEQEFAAYGATGYGVNVSCGDVDGDGFDEIVTGAGPGPIYGPHVRGFGADGASIPGLSFLAYGTPRWGVNVACGDLDGDGRDEIVTGAGPGAVFGPHVRAFGFGGQGVGPLAGVNFFAYGTLRWGVNVTCGDLDGDGREELVTGAGPGAVFGPHVRAFGFDGQGVSPLAGVSFLAFETLHYGVRVSCGDVDGDGIDEIITAPGPSPAFGAQVRGWNVDGGAVSELPGCSVLAWGAHVARYGAVVEAGADLDGDGRDEIIVGGGPDPALGSPVLLLRYDGDTVHPWFELVAFPGGWTHGCRVAGGLLEVSP